jgi:putative ABC transport system permease protein
LQPNFFILFSPPALRDFPSTYMTSFRLKASEKRALNELLAEFPTLTVIEVDQIIAEVQNVVTRVSQAVELVLALTLVSGCLVLIASIQASRDERLQEHALLRALGGPSRLIRGALAAEFALLGAFAGTIATVGAEVTAAVLAIQVFELSGRVHPWLWLAGPAIGAALIAGVGLAGTGRLVKAPPIAVLREMT